MWKPPMKDGNTVGLFLILITLSVTTLQCGSHEEPPVFVADPLPYAQDALEPYISAQTMALDRWRLFQGPGRPVEVVDQRLSHIVATQPGKTVLVAVLHFEFGQARGPRRVAIGTADEILFDRYDLADLPVAHPLDGFLDCRMEPALQSR